MSLKDVFIDGVLLQSIGVVGLLFTRKKTAAEACPPAAAPPDAAAPADAEREGLRREHQVRLVNGDEEGFGVARLPNGVYGFTFAPLGEAPLFAKCHYRSYEMHVLPDGSVHLVAYVTIADAARIQAGREELETRIYPEPFEDATHMLSIPIERLQARKLLPSREGGNWIAVTVHPTAG